MVVFALPHGPGWTMSGAAGNYPFKKVSGRDGTKRRRKRNPGAFKGADLVFSVFAGFRKLRILR